MAVPCKKTNGDNSLTRPISISIFRARNEIYSLMNDQDIYRNFKTPIEDSIENMGLPNSMFINGIVVNLENASGCQIKEGIMIR